MTGSFPDTVDHINHCGTDNRWCNLQDGSLSDNSKNKSMYAVNKSGATGVYFYQNKWRANIRIDGELKHLGSFVGFSDAVDARKNAEVLYGFHTNHGE